MSEHHFDGGPAGCPVDGCPVTYGRVIELFDSWRDPSDVYWSELSEMSKRQWWRVAHVAAHQSGELGMRGRPR